MRPTTVALFRKKSSVVLALVLAMGAQAVIAQAPPTGGQIQQIPGAPMPERASPEIRFEPGKVPAVPAADATRIVVRSLRVTGQALYSEEELVALTGFNPGREMSLSELREMAARIAEHYRANGYFMAQAYLPAQDIRDGAVTIAVLEGRYGNVVQRNESNLASSIPSSLLEGLKPGDPIAIAPLESRLLLLSDVPGVNVKSTLVPGASVGASDLIVELTPGRRVTGSVEADNAGNRYTGKYRVGATVNLNNLAGLGDVASLRVLTSGQGLKYGRASYQVQLGRGTAGVAYSALAYELGEEFAPLQAHGTVEIASLFGSYPLIRSRSTNLYAVVGLDAKTFQDRVDSTVPPSVTDKKVNVLNSSLHGNHRDNLGGGGLSSYSVTWSTGSVDIETPAALAADRAGPRTQGHFDKIGFHAARLQTVTDRVSVSAAINGQVASKNLDVSEKLGLGGLYGVRSYPVGEGYGDEGYIANLEARLLLPKFWPAAPGQFHLIGFVDTGTVRINKNPFAAGNNSRTLSGAGVGLSWAAYNDFMLSMYWAHKLGSERTLSEPDASSRFWIRGVKFF